MKKKYRLPILIEKDEDGFYVVECPVLLGCYSQGKSLKEATKNLQEVINMYLEEVFSLFGQVKFDSQYDYKKTRERKVSI